MRQKRIAGLLGRALGLGLAFVILAMAAWPAAQAGSPAAFQVALPIIMVPPGPYFLPIISKAPLAPVVDLSINRIEIIQGITMSDAYTVQVANRPALVRVFVNLSGAGTQPGVSGRLTRYVGGNAQDSLDAGPITVLAVTSEGSLAETLNFTLPANWLAAGTSYVFQLDPSNSVAETNENNNRYPPGGQASFNFQGAPTLDVVVVPVHYARSGATATDPPTADLSYLTWMPIRVYPLSQINYSLHASITFSGDLRPSDGSGWEALLQQITTLHSQEDLAEHKNYFGLVDSVAADGCGGGCIAGIGWINQQNGFASKSAVGFAGFPGDRNQASPTMTHEMGHNFGRNHAPCGVTGEGPFPYPNASIGQWGYDNVTAQLFDPNTYRDYMSYCHPAWTSDFTYKAIFDAWSWVSAPFGAAAQASPADAWVVSGSFNGANQWQVGPAHVQAMPSISPAASGPLRLDLVDATGQVFRSQMFAAVPISIDRLDSGFDQQGFRVVLPPALGATGFRIYQGDQVVYQRVAQGPAPSLASTLSTATTAEGTRLGWNLASGPADVTYSVRLSNDGGQSWQVLAVDQPASSILLPATSAKGGGALLVEVQASDGVRTDTRAYAAGAP